MFLLSFNVVLQTNVQYSPRHSLINRCDRRITLLTDNDISFGLFNQFILLYAFWVIVSNTLNAKNVLKIYLIGQKIYPNNQDE